MSATPAPAPGMRPALQRHWDLRAACNFVAGGIGSGLIVASALSGVHGTLTAVTLVAGLALVASGLFAVWLEIGRPWRAINVFRHPQRSWMSRESLAALVLALVVPLAAWLEVTRSAAAPSALLVALLAALGFAWCQGRMLHAAKGIPAWRSPAIPSLIVATALAEGGGAWWIAAASVGAGTQAALAIFGVVLLARLAAWLAYRRTLRDAPRAAAALVLPGHVLLVAGTLVPLALIVVAALSTTAATVSACAAAAGALAIVGGAAFKAALIVRASFNQGYALPRMPVRGQPARMPAGRAEGARP